MNCNYCNDPCKKKGIRNGKQKYQCCSCHKYQQDEYTYQAYFPAKTSWVGSLMKEGNSIRGISRLLGISKNTVIKRINNLSKRTSRPVITRGGKYQLDEMCTYVGNKNNRIWIAYAIRTDTKEVVDFRVGKRTNRTLRPVVETLLLSEAKRINTDRLRQYRSLIPSKIHRVKQFGINHI